MMWKWYHLSINIELLHILEYEQKNTHKTSFFFSLKERGEKKKKSSKPAYSILVAVKTTLYHW